MQLARRQLLQSSFGSNEVNLCKRLLSTSSARASRAVLFPGQGSQEPGMLTEYAEKYPRIVKPILEELDESLKQKFSEALLSKGAHEKIDMNQTLNAQPAILTTSYTIIQILNHLNNGDILNSTNFQFALGHSLGEYTACTATGILKFADAAMLVRERGRAMEESKNAFLVKNGEDIELGMYAVLFTGLKNISGTASEHIVKLIDTEISKQADLDPLFKYVGLGNINSGSQIVFSGPRVAIDQLLSKLKTLLNAKRSFKVFPLNVSAPFHSPVMQLAQDRMQEIFSQKDTVRLNWPSAVPIVANNNARPFESVEQVQSSLIKSCTERVYWLDSINYVCNTNSVSELVAVGPGNVGDLTKRDLGASVSTKLLQADTLEEFLTTL